MTRLTLVALSALAGAIIAIAFTPHPIPVSGDAPGVPDNAFEARSLSMVVEGLKRMLAESHELAQIVESAGNAQGSDFAPARSEEKLMTGQNAAFDDEQEIVSPPKQLFIPVYSELSPRAAHVFGVPDDQKLFMHLCPANTANARFMAAGETCPHCLRTVGQ